MKFSQAVNSGIFLKRYKRFFAEIQTEHETLTAHVPNTGSLKGCLWPESPCRYSINTNPHRKLPYTLEMVKTPSSWVGINTLLANELVWEAWTQRLMPHWREWKQAQKEVRLHSKTRIDLVLRPDSPEENSQRLRAEDMASQPLHFIEVKNVTLGENGIAYFPDAVTKRGQKHIHELMDLRKQGHSTELVFTIQRQDCQRFSPASGIDPEYAKLLYQAHQQGLRITPLSCHLKETGIELIPEPLPTDFTNVNSQ